jgi:hypothetical protein
MGTRGGPNARYGRALGNLSEGIKLGGKKRGREGEMLPLQLSTHERLPGSRALGTYHRHQRLRSLQRLIKYIRIILVYGT